MLSRKNISKYNIEDELPGKQVAASGTNVLDLQNSHTLLVPEPILTRRGVLLRIPCTPRGLYGVGLGNSIIPQAH